MKNLKRIMIAILAIVAISSTANAQLRWGIKGGVNINKVHFSEAVLNDLGDPSNHAGYQVGLMTEFTVPVVGVGFDASLMFNHRKIGDGEQGSANYLDLPIHLKYKIGIPAVGNLISPYLFVGPDFAVNLSAKDVENGFKEKKFDCFLDLGLGVQLFNHLQVGAGYSWGLTKAFDAVGVAQGAGTAKINGWTITAAYLF